MLVTLPGTRHARAGESICRVQRQTGRRWRPCASSKMFAPVCPRRGSRVFLRWGANTRHGPPLRATMHGTPPRWHAAPGRRRRTRRHTPSGAPRQACPRGEVRGTRGMHRVARCVRRHRVAAVLRIRQMHGRRRCSGARPLLRWVGREHALAPARVHTGRAAVKGHATGGSDWNTVILSFGVGKNILIIQSIGIYSIGPVPVNRRAAQCHLRCVRTAGTRLRLMCPAQC